MEYPRGFLVCVLGETELKSEAFGRFTTTDTLALLQDATTVLTELVSNVVYEATRGLDEKEISLSEMAERLHPKNFPSCND